MDGNHPQMHFDSLCYAVRGCIFEVYRHLGAGFLEKVYHRALLAELTSRGIRTRSDVEIPVHYKGTAVGRFLADLVVEGEVVVEIKAQPHLTKLHEAQLLNYLKASNCKVGLLVNFTHPRATIRRFVY